METVTKVPYRARIPGDAIRPLIEIEMKNVGMILCILDSGADVTTMPISIAEKAGIPAKQLGQKSCPNVPMGIRQ